MALDIDISHYNTGTATVAADGSEVTGQGTTWTVLRKGDLFGTHIGMPVRIAAINSDTSLTLAYPWKGQAQAAAPYEIQRTPFDIGYLAGIEELLRRWGGGNVDAFAELVLGARKLLATDPNGELGQTDLSDFMRGLLAGADDATVRAALGAGTGDFVGPNGGVADGQLVAFNGTTGKAGKLATMASATVMGRPSYLSAGAPVDIPAMYFAVFEPSGFATADLTPAQFGTMFGRSGFYKLARSSENIADAIQMPPGFPQSHGVLRGYHNIISGPNYAWQKFTGHTGNREWMRRAVNASTWGPWQEIYHQGNILGTVSQSSGVPTGAIIERGSNANGEYIKWADGTQICTHELTQSTPGNTPNGPFWLAILPTWTFPASFISKPRIIGTPVRQAVGGANVVAVSRPSSSDYSQTSIGSLGVWFHASNENAVGYVSITAIGRWF